MNLISKAFSLSVVVSVLVTLPSFAEDLLPSSEATVQEASSVNMLNVTSSVPLLAKDYLGVSLQEVPGKGKFQGVQYTLKNLQANHIQVIQAEVINGIDEMVAAQQEAESKNKKRRLGGGLLRGLSGLGMSAIPYAGSLAAVQAASVGSQVVNAAANTMEASDETGAGNYEGRFVRQVSSVVISPNSQFHFSSLVPKGAKPQFKVTFKDLKTNEIYDLIQ